MSKLIVDQKTVMGLLRDTKAKFLIPDYQRPYAWDEKSECQQLWDDLYAFCFPQDNGDNFKSTDEYFLGPIVVFKNEHGNMEVIDGQQRLTTLMLLLRAFYEKLGNGQERKTKRMHDNIESCLWLTDDYGEFDQENIKLDSEVATDEKKGEMLAILKHGDDLEKQSKYAVNYRFFKKCIDQLLAKKPAELTDFIARILNNCVLLPIEAESQDTALRIFSTLNDRGKPLSDADIFKAQFYKLYKDHGRKDEMIDCWRELDRITTKLFHPISGTPLDELFTRYMYFERSKQGISSSTTEALRKFYEKDSYKIFRQPGTLDNLMSLAKFWEAVDERRDDLFSDDVYRRLYILNAAPNGMWRYIVSVYFMQNRNAEGQLDEAPFVRFLDIITLFIWAYTIVNPGVNSLRTPLFAEMVNIVKGRPVSFANYQIEEKTFRSLFSTYEFTNNRYITRSYLTWWAFTFEGQKLPELGKPFDIEHIYPRKRQENEGGLSNPKSLEMLGNKALLETKINIRASDYKYADKKKYYAGFQTSNGTKKEGTMIVELAAMANDAKRSNFTEADITARQQLMVDTFVNALRDFNLLK